MSELYVPDGTELKERIVKDIDCGKSIVTRYYHTGFISKENPTGFVRQDCEIQVDPEKLPKMGSKDGKVLF